MIRLRNIDSGAIVCVPESKAARMGSGWVPIQPEPETKPTARRRKPAAKD